MNTDNFDRSATRKFNVVLAIFALWVLFLISAISTLLFLLGRWLGVW